MSARGDMLAALRANRPAGAHELPALPLFPIEDGGDLVGFFLRNLETMGGTHLAFGDVALPASGVVASMVPEFSGNRDLAAVARPGALADVDVAIVRASFGVAETGSVLLTDADLGVNAVAYLAQHLVVLLDPDDLVASLQEAYRRPELRQHRYASFHTGPSATADIEGVLIRGAQGVRSLTVVLRRRG